MLPFWGHLAPTQEGGDTGVQTQMYPDRGATAPTEEQPHRARPKSEAEKPTHEVKIATYTQIASSSDVLPTPACHHITLHHRIKHTSKCTIEVVPTGTPKPHLKHAHLRSPRRKTPLNTTNHLGNLRYMNSCRYQIIPHTKTR